MQVLVEMKGKITGRVEEWWKSVCQKHNCKYYIHEDYPSCSYCTCPGNCIVVEECKVESEDEKMELRNEEKGYLENDKESVLETAQNIIADESFQYGGDSLTVLEIINAIKDGYRLANLAEVDRRICDAFDKGFEEGLRAAKGE